MNNVDKQYTELVKDVLNNGVLHPTRAKIDGKNVSAYTVFGRQARFNFAEGFPILTTKTVSFNNIAHEFAWMISGDTNIKYLEDNKVTIWREWADDDGDLGPVYGKQFRNIEHHEWVKPLILENHHKYDDQISNISHTPEIDYSQNNCGFVGKEIQTLSGKCIVVKEEPTTKEFQHSKFLVYFYETRFRKIVSYNDIISKKIKDPYHKSVYEVGYYGEYDKNDKDIDALKSVWRDMLKRCYNNKSKHYKGYGGKGIFVHKDWECFALFQKEVKEIPNWCLKKEYPENYTLDKDILYSSNCYSKKTCMWASLEEQQLNGSTITPFVATSPNGENFFSPTIGYLSRKFRLNLSAIHRCLNGLLKSHHGWTNFKYIKKDGYILRTRIIDQLKSIIATIKHNPNDRRMVISLWSPGDLPKMALPPCHGIVIQFYVDGDRLSLHTYQRSIDTFLGYPYNISFYSLLLCVVAHLTNLKPHELIYSLGNLHIYENHVNQVLEQTKRSMLSLPQLWIDPNLKSIDDFRRESVKLVGYKHQGVLKGEVAV